MTMRVPPPFRADRGRRYRRYPVEDEATLRGAIYRVLDGMRANQGLSIIAFETVRRSMINGESIKLRTVADACGDMGLDLDKPADWRAFADLVAVEMEAKLPGSEDQP